MENAPNTPQLSVGLIIANQTNIQTSSTLREAQGCVVVLDIRQYAGVLRLALHSPTSFPFVRLSIWIAIIFFAAFTNLTYTEFSQRKRSNQS